MRDRKRKSRKFTKFLFLLFVAGVCWIAYQWRHSLLDLWAKSSENAYDKAIYAAARKHNVDPLFIKAVIYRETRFQPNTRGGAGEVGLMQIIPNKAVADWAIAHDVKVPCDGVLFKPQVNIDIGTWYLKQGLKRWRRYKYYRELALCQYNAGGSWAKKWAPPQTDDAVIDRITINSTKQYVKNIIKKYNNYRARLKK